MKIAIISCFFSPRIGGIEKYTEQLATHLSKTEEITILTSEEKAKPNKNYNLIKLPNRKLSKYILPKIIPTFKTLKAINPDIIHLNGPLPYATLTALIAKPLKIPTILTYHGNPNPKAKSLKLIIWLEKQLYRFLFNQIIVTSQKYKSKVAKFYPKKKISVIHLGIEEHFFKPLNKENCRKELSLHPNKPYILFVGKLDENHYYKGLNTLLKAAAKLPKIKFLIIGSGNQIKQFKTSNHQANINLLGKIPDNQMPKYFTACDITTLPSNSSSEGFGIVLLESAACTTPIITTSVVGSSDFISKNNLGLIIPPNSPIELSKAIKNLLQNKKLHQKLSENCKKTTKQMNWQTASDKTLKVYKSIQKS